MADKEDKKTAGQDAGAPAFVAAATVAAEPAEAPGDDSSAATVTLTEAELRSAVARGVESWCRAHLRNTPVARATEAFSYLNTVAVPDLAPTIMKEIL